MSSSEGAHDIHPCQACELRFPDDSSLTLDSFDKHSNTYRPPGLPSLPSAIRNSRPPRQNTTNMAAAIKALNARIRANPVSDYFWQVRATQCSRILC